MSKQIVIPVGKKVLVKEKKAETYFGNTNILIPDSAKKPTYQGYVVGVGEGVEEIKVGDLVQYASYATPTEMMHEDEIHLLISEGDIQCKLKLND